MMSGIGERYLFTCPHCEANDAREITRVGDKALTYRCGKCETTWVESRRVEWTVADSLIDRRVISPEYGHGKVVAVLPIGVQVWYDQPLVGTVDTHMLVHDPAYVERWLDQ